MTKTQTTVEVQPVATAEDLKHFVRFPWRIYAHDPYWVPPIISQIEKRLDTQRNPFWEYAERELFLARRNGGVVGTVAAIVNHQHNRQLNDRTGFFGFFEAINDHEVAEALIAAASDWLRERGMDLIRGPVNGAPTDEVGVQIAGFDRRPSIWEGHTPPYYRELIERLGFRKYDDYLAYEVWFKDLDWDLRNLPPKIWRVAEKARDRTGVTIRKIDVSQWDAEVAKVHYLYNVAFRTIPGHIDMSLEKFANMAASLRPFLDPNLVVIAEVDGEPVGFAVALMDVNEALCHFRSGKLYLWDLIRLKWHMGRIRTACGKMLGILPEYRIRGLEILLALELGRHVLRKGYERVEISLLQEKNTLINRFVQHVGAQPYLVYRVYEKPL
ncbi:MAG: N-acetyltransferase [Anaerolineae bacterium]